MKLLDTYLEGGPGATKFHEMLPHAQAAIYYAELKKQEKAIRKLKSKVRYHRRQTELWRGIVRWYELKHGRSYVIRHGRVEQA